MQASSVWWQGCMKKGTTTCTTWHARTAPHEGGAGALMALRTQGSMAYCTVVCKPTTTRAKASNVAAALHAARDARLVIAVPSVDTGQDAVRDRRR